MANPAAAAQHQARGGDAAERARGTAACPVAPRRPRPRQLTPSSPARARRRRARRARLPGSSQLQGFQPVSRRLRTLRPPVRGCWAGAAPSSRGLLGGCALCPLRRRSAGRTVAAPRLVLRRRRRVRHGEGSCCGAKVSDLAKNSEHPCFSRTKLPQAWKTALALFYSTGSFFRTKLPPPIIAGPVGRPLPGLSMSAAPLVSIKFAQWPGPGRHVTVRFY